MIQILEYISQHYILFLGGAILILLAIIGYYADKTNFGQGKNFDDKDNSTLEQINEMDDISLLNITSQTGNNTIEVKVESNDLVQNENVQNLPDMQLPYVENLQSDDSDETSIVENLQSDDLGETSIVENSNQLEGKTSETIVNDSITGTIDEEFNKEQDSFYSNISNEESDKENVILSEEEINKFNDEFNSILPKKGLIDAELLGDIDDLSLDKTQKIDLSDISGLDDIELPKIKSLSTEEQDIWKF